ncbi:hypothetical protein FACS189449_02730 [Alphaproteobacteria bacterium]|nr:hypothetical protein FACS189449_02730 [Alphaproteobacteria bacterium]
MTKALFGLSDQELWKLFPIVVSKYQENWAEIYETEKELLEKQIGSDKILRINHFGSTAVPGLSAKPIIDILVEVSENTDIDPLAKRIGKIGYINVRSESEPYPNAVFLKGYAQDGFRGQAFHLHVRNFGDWDELRFRDYLRQHPEVSEEYGQLKNALGKKFKFDRDSYSVAKTDFVLRITELAKRNIPREADSFQFSNSTYS